MAKQITRDRKLTPEEAAKYRKICEEVEFEKPDIIAKAQQARNEARRQQLAAIMRKLKATREASQLRKLFPNPYSHNPWYRKPGHPRATSSQERSAMFL